MISAAVNDQPFGGERLSGTGPNAGGPYYRIALLLSASAVLRQVALGGFGPVVVA